jgi:D-3-phosphoglycerate dehydrogenase / 2-oxoglutarate reductase
MSRRIAITPRSISETGHPALSLLTAQGYELVFPAPGRIPTEEDLLRDLPLCVGYLAGVEPITRRVLDASPHLKVISRNGTGTDAIDLIAAREHGVAIERAVGANARGVAELALALMLDALRHVTWSNAHMKASQWKRRKGRECQGRTLGVVGCGAIGRTLAGFARGLDMNVIGYDPLLNGTPGDPPIPLVTLETLVESADVISLHCPPSEQPLIDAEAIAHVREGVALVNTARGELIDPEAVLAGLESGRISVYATDVYVSEPPQLTPLLAHPNVILTPHAGGLTDESVERATTIAVHNLLARLQAECG